MDLIWSHRNGQRQVWSRNDSATGWASETVVIEAPNVLAAMDEAIDAAASAGALLVGCSLPTPIALAMTWLCPVAAFAKAGAPMLALLTGIAANQLAAITARSCPLTMPITIDIGRDIVAGPVRRDGRQVLRVDDSVLIVVAREDI